jgi:hypothetical protein
LPPSARAATASSRWRATGRIVAIKFFVPDEEEEEDNGYTNLARFSL